MFEITGAVVSTIETVCGELLALNPRPSVTSRNIEWTPIPSVTVAVDEDAI
jgi:hypothetical protein